MELLNKLVCQSLPESLSRVPIPDSFGGIFRLSPSEFIRLATFSGVTGFITYSIYHTVRFHVCKYRSGGCQMNKGATASGRINLDVCKHQDKCVDSVDIEDVGKKACFCRCWRSSKFPYCDGSHNKHNSETGDNVGPLIIKARD